MGGELPIAKCAGRRLPRGALGGKTPPQGGRGLPWTPRACESSGAWGAGSELRGRHDALAPRPPSPELSASPRSRPRLTSSWLPGGHGAGGEGAARRGASEAAGPGRGGSASG